MPAQLKELKGGSEKIFGFIWHHHQDTGRMRRVLVKLVTTIIADIRINRAHDLSVDMT